MLNLNMKQGETGENRLFMSSIFRFEFWLLLILVCTIGATCVTIEETIPESSATNSLSASKYINNTDMATPSINTTIYNNLQIPGSSNASNSVAGTGENLTSFGVTETERREMLGANADADATANTKSGSINYKDMPHRYHGSNSKPNETANPYERPCNHEDRCRDGN